MTPAALHHNQELRDSCVAACVRMLLLRSGGEDASEAGIRARLGPHPISLARARIFGTYRHLGIDDPAGIEVLLGIVKAGWCAVTVADGPAAAWAGRAGLTSPHGSLATLGPRARRLEEQATGHHAIVLVEVAGDRVRYLDPWFSAPGQPVETGLEDFVKWGWIGNALHLH